MTAEEDHSPRGPSTAHRWRKCAASVREERGLPDTAGVFAAEGTAFHSFGADCLEMGIPPHTMIGAKTVVPGFGTYVMDQTMAGHMRVGYDLVMALSSDPGCKLFIEKKVPLDEWIGPGEIGTLDVGIINVQKRRITTFDWKYGAGVPVSPEENDQGILYTLGLWTQWGEEAFAGIAPEDIQVTIIIEQPRAAGGGGVWETTMARILETGRAIRKAADLTLKPDAPYAPSAETCKFCKAAYHNTCKVRAAFVLDSLGAKFDTLEGQISEIEPLDLRPLRALSPEARTQLVLNRKMIGQYLEQVHQEAMSDAEKGLPTPGLKLVMGRASPRKWRDEDKAAILLEKELAQAAYQKKILSPTQAEEAIGKQEFATRFGALVQAGEPHPILVSAADKRPPVSTVHDKFDSIHDDTSLI
jgi:hypothetical protein